MTFDCPHLGCAKEYKCKRDLIAHALAVHKIVLSDADVQRAAYLYNLRVASARMLVERQRAFTCLMMPCSEKFATKEDLCQHTLVTHGIDQEKILHAKNQLRQFHEDKLPLTAAERSEVNNIVAFSLLVDE